MIVEALTVALLLVGAAPADDALEHYRRAQAAYGAGRYDEAAEAFRAAWQATDEPALLHNHARSLEKAGQLQKAREAFHRLLRYATLAPELRRRGGADLERVLGKLREEAETSRRVAAEASLLLQLADATLPPGRRAELVAKRKQLRGQRRAAGKRLAAQESARRAQLAALRQDLADAKLKADRDRTARIAESIAARETEARIRMNRLETRLALLAERANDANRATRAEQLAEEAELRMRIHALTRANADYVDRNVAWPGATGTIGVGISSQPPDRARVYAGWTLLSTGFVVVGVGVGLRVHASSLRDELRVSQQGIVAGGVVTGISQARALELRDQANASETAAWVSVGVGAAALTTGIVLLLLDALDEHPGPALAPAVSPTSAGAVMGLSGSF